MTDPSNPVQLALTQMPLGVTVQDLRVTPDGAHVLVTTDRRKNQFTELSVPDLTPETTYTLAGDGRALVPSPDGSMVAAATDDDTTRLTIALFHAGSPTPVASYDLGDAVANDLRHRALAFSTTASTCSS